MIVGSGGGGGDAGGWACSCEEMEPGEESFLCVSRRVVRVCWRSETRVKGVMFGRWRWASRIVLIVTR